MHVFRYVRPSSYVQILLTKQMVTTCVCFGMCFLLPNVMSKEVAAEIEIVTLARHIFLADVSTLFHLAVMSVHCTQEAKNEERFIN